MARGPRRGVLGDLPGPRIEPLARAPAALPASGDLRSRFHAALLEAKLISLADALEHSELAESSGELVFTTPKIYQLNVKQPEFEAIAKKAAGRPVRVTIKIGAAAPATPVAPAPKREDEATARALSHPVVKRFQDVFEDSQVRTVRNLKDT